MRIIVMGQEEPVHMGPFLIRVLEARRADVVAVAVGRVRGAGGRPKNWRAGWDRVKILWLLIEPWHFFAGLAVRVGWQILRWLGPLGRPIDGRSLDRAAERLGIPVVYFEDPNDDAVLARLREFAPDLLFNQSECILGPKVLALPTRGVVNRHGSRLPRHRGRLASFWAHADGHDRYDITVHFVDVGIDSGPIILQREFPTDACATYGAVLTKVFKSSPEVVLEAFARLERADFAALPNDVSQGTLNKFPTLEDARAYRAALDARRRARAEKGP
ncbi:MAG: hypothetical protein HZA54_01155 [Planctomycetes bacterium]|nr:hypothetical protein [Planctomycetota bacterium]